MALRHLRLALRLAASSQSSQRNMRALSGLDLLQHQVFVLPSLSAPYSTDNSREWSSAPSLSRPKQWTKDLRDYNRLIALVNKKKRGHLNRTVYDDMVMDGVQPAMETFSLLIDGCMKDSRLQDVIYFFEEMKAMGLNPDVACYNAVITSCGKALHVDRAFQVAAEMEASGIPSRHRTYLALMRSCALAGRVDDAYGVVRKMAATGLSLNDDYYSALILAHKHKKPPAEGAVHKIFEVLEQSKKNSTEDLMAAAATGESDEVRDDEDDALAMMLLDEVRPRRVFLNRKLTVYHAAVNALSAMGEKEAAKTVLKLVEIDGHEPDLYCVMELMKLYLVEKDFEKACAEYSKYVDSGQQPTLELYLLLIEGAVTNGSSAAFAVARRLLTELSQKGYFLNAQVGSQLMLRVCHSRPTDIIVANLIWDMMKSRELTISKYITQEYFKALEANVSKDDARLIHVKNLLDAGRRTDTRPPQNAAPTPTIQGGVHGSSSASERMAEVAGPTEKIVESEVAVEQLYQPTASLVHTEESTAVSEELVGSATVSDDMAQPAAPVERVAP